MGGGAVVHPASFTEPDGVKDQQPTAMDAG
jgi:hypothetical protein